MMRKVSLWVSVFDRHLITVCPFPWQSPEFNIISSFAMCTEFQEDGVRCTPNDPVECSGRNPVCIFSKKSKSYRCCSDYPQDISSPPGNPEQVKPSELSLWLYPNKTFFNVTNFQFVPTVLPPMIFHRCCCVIPVIRSLVPRGTVARRRLIRRCCRLTTCISAANPRL